MLVILATQEAEIRRIKFQSQLQANSLQDPISKKKKKKKKSQKSAGGTRPSVQTPVLPKRKKEKKEEVFQQLY
jgi:hypothetical protein